jgi:hypothetical protein
VIARHTFDHRARALLDDLAAAIAARSKVV